MFYRYWKKIALALTGFFWVSCDSDASVTKVSEIPLDDNSSDSGKIVSSESKGADQSSSSTLKEDSSSSSMEQAVALYGVPNEVVNCYLNKGNSTVFCEDRTTCEQVTTERFESPKCVEDVCPEYGVLLVSENTYRCDGKIYNEAQFKARYSIVYEYDPSKEPVICDETDENTVMCRDGVTYTITTDENGNKTYTDQEGSSLSEKEFEEKYVIQREEYAPLYGILL